MLSACSAAGCKIPFHVSCAQLAGLEMRELGKESEASSSSAEAGDGKYAQVDSSSSSGASSSSADKGSTDVEMMPAAAPGSPGSSSSSSSELESSQDNNTSSSAVQTHLLLSCLLLTRACEQPSFVVFCWKHGKTPMPKPDVISHAPSVRSSKSRC